MSSEKCPSITRRLEDVIWIRDWSLEPRKPTTYRAQPSISGLKHTSAAAADMPMSLKHRHTRWNAKEPHPQGGVAREATACECREHHDVPYARRPAVRSHFNG